MAEKNERVIEGMKLRVAPLKPAKPAAKLKIVLIEVEGDDATLRNAMDAIHGLLPEMPTQK